MTQSARVRRIVDSNRAEVVVRRQSACSHDCSRCGGCSAGADVHEVSVVAENPLGAGVGDTVTVESSTGQVIGIAAVVYLLPILLFFGLYLVGAVLSLGSGVSLALGGVGFLASIGVILLYGRARQKRDIPFRIVGIG